MIFKGLVERYGCKFIIITALINRCTLDRRELTMAGYRTMMALLLTVGIVFQRSESRVTCRNDEGNEVDWLVDILICGILEYPPFQSVCRECNKIYFLCMIRYILYKLPLGHSGKGLSYLYMDASTNGWKLSGNTIDSSSGTLGKTLKPLLDYYVRKTERFGYILYNDKPVSSKPSVSTAYGHSKGVVMLDRATGVWLSHSTPSFPTDQSKSFWPESGNVNGQTFLCVTYSYGTFKEIGLQLKYIHPYAYDHFIPPTFHMELQDVAQNTGFPRKDPFSRVKNLRSEGGELFLSFAKYTRFNDDLYSGLIVKSMPESLYVKGWGNKGRSVLLPSNCSTGTPHHVYNVKNVKLWKNVYRDTQDHSKWCVAPNSGWTCIADLNRHESQKKRGGGAICIKDVTVTKAFRTTIKTYEPCPSPVIPHSSEL